MMSWITDNLASPVRGKSSKLARAIRLGIENGSLTQNTKMPSHRQLAAQMDVSVGTVAQAYRLLSQEGWLHSHVGRGSFVTIPTDGKPISTAPDPGIIDLSYVHPPIVHGAPDQQMQEMSTILHLLADRWNELKLGDVLPEAGLPHQRAAASQWLRDKGVNCAPETVIVTVGAQEALTTVFTTLCRRRSTVLAEPLTIASVKELIGTIGLNLEPVDCDAEGMLPEALALSAKNRNARVMFVQPDLQSPTTAQMGGERRAQIAKMARDLDLIVIEYSGWTGVTEARLPSLTAFAPERVIHVSGFSNPLVAGLRSAILHVPAAIMGRVLATRHSLMLSTPSLLAETTSQLIETGAADRLAQAVSCENHARLEIAKSILHDRMSDAPRGSPFIWLPKSSQDAHNNLSARALEVGVKVLDQDYFLTSKKSREKGIRVALSSAADRDVLVFALSKLADIL